MYNINVKSGIVVNVNDAGDTIVINVEDQGFIDRFMELLEKVDKISNSSVDTEGKTEREKLHIVIDATKEIMSGIDEVFGENTCQKVFGDIIPSPYLIEDFFDQIAPIAKQYMDERQKKIAAKYSNRRKGARSNVRK